mmetsp:Transcript_47561/g.112150  ORF Transcript_47561/g.112150 Transcript_47561/m.112150 type:complete len:513 (+) Transcript_47561:78-1616(+)
MGNCCTGPKPPPQTSPDANKQQPQPVYTPPPPQAQPEDPNKPRAQVFAIMRNGHEVIRGLMKDCEVAPDMSAFRRALAILMRWQELHAMSEDGTPFCKGFFAVVNERFENLAHQKGLLAAHRDLHALETKLIQTAAAPSTTLDQVKPVYMEWQAANEKHLKAEEDVMMPCVKKMMEGQVNLKELLQMEIMPTIWDRPDFGFFVQHAAATLEKYPDGQPRARVWVHALLAISPAERWARYLPYVKAGLSPSLFKAINDEIGMEAPGVPLWAKADPAPKATEKAKLMAFAIMRNGHEVIRGMMKDILVAPDPQVFRERVAVMLKWQELHALTEDGTQGCRGFFAVINDKFDNKASQAGLLVAHNKLHPLEEQLKMACADPRLRLGQLMTLYRQFMDANEQHLKEEEGVMMPCVSKMAQDGVNLKEILVTDVLPCIWDRPEFGFFVQAGAATLEKYPEGMPRARVFLHAISKALPPERWARALPYVKAGLSPALYKIVNAETDFDPNSPASFDGA